MKYCDLHTHTNGSDGTDTPYELCQNAKKIGLGAIAITDHNTVKNIFELEKCAKEMGLDYILGSEITTEHNGKEVHMLCMCINKNNAPCVADFTDVMQKSKRQGNLNLAKKLREGGYQIYLENLEKRFGDNINRAHFAKVLVEMGVVATMKEAFSGILKEGNGFYIPSERPTTVDTIKRIREWKCVPVLAHPLLSFIPEKLEEALPLFKQAGLIGMEAYYPKFTQEQTDYLLSFCEKYSLIPLGGSDYHGANKTDADLGSARVPYSCYENLKNAYRQIN